MPVDVELIRGLLALSAILGVGALLGWCLFGLVASRCRAYSRHVKRQDAVIAGLKTDLAAGAKMLLEKEARVETVARKYEAELARVDKIRQRTEAGCRAKDAELQEALERLAKVHP